MQIRGAKWAKAAPKGNSLEKACQVALAHSPRPAPAVARRFFESWFVPTRVVTAGNGFFTGYYEPQFRGSLSRTPAYSAPLLARPERLPSPAPDRAAIEAGALAGLGLELVWLDSVDAFFVHIQGAARIQLDDGRVVRVGFAGRNNHPFTPIGRLLVERGAMTLEQANMQTIRNWLRVHPDAAPALMRENKSYIFFKFDRDRPADEGPLGAQQVPLSAGRSLAVDHGIWPYGLPVWVDARLPSAQGEAHWRRLMIAQDTGSAIKGAARGDIFVGSGDEAGRIAGSFKHPGEFIVLLPRAETAK